MQEVKKIVVLGPESTGKSSLCALLAEHYKTVWCPEYAREYLLVNGMNYTYNDLLTIAKAQIDLEDEYLEKVSGPPSIVHRPASENSPSLIIPSVSGANDEKSSQWTMDDGRWTSPAPPLLFVDTDMYVMKVWCEYVFNQCHSFILEKIVERKYDLYLLCNIELPWIKDELREYPDLKRRKELYEIYKDILINQTVPWAEVSGNYEQRLHTAIKAVDALITS